jgi:diguanylate cyclase (GGDEF)-like protein
MSGILNAVLEFLIDHYQIFAGGLGAVVILYIVTRLASSGESDKDVVSTGWSEAEYRTQTLIKELKADNRDLKNRVSRLSNTNGLLAPLIKELTSNLERRRMGPIVVKFIERLFNPRQAMVFFLNDEKTHLILAAQEGVSGVHEGFSLEIGQGFAGVVAKKGVMVTREDLRHESTVTQESVRTCDPKSFRIDVATPIVNRGEILGVTCMGMGGPGDVITNDVRALFSMVADMTALALTNYIQYRRIEELANSDPMTRIYNKGYFIEVAERELGQARLDDIPMSMLMLDVDNFKNYNDTNGHLAGDRLLKALAELLKGAIRERDVVARFGGEEFIVLLHGVDVDEAYEAAERIRRQIQDYPFPHGETQPLGYLSASIGVASTPRHAIGMENTIQAADEALYVAKKEGRNRVVRATVGSREVETADY